MLTMLARVHSFVLCARRKVVGRMRNRIDEGVRGESLSRNYCSMSHSPARRTCGRALPARSSVSAGCSDRSLLVRGAPLQQPSAPLSNPRPALSSPQSKRKVYTFSLASGRWTAVIEILANGSDSPPSYVAFRPSAPRVLLAVPSPTGLWRPFWRPRGHSDRTPDRRHCHHF